MSELEEKLNALMSNPQLMQQVAAMAQSIGTANQDHQEAPAPAFPTLGPQQMQILAQAANFGSADQNQQALLSALTPYLSQSRIQKLDRAMRASKMAGAASLFLNSDGLQLLTGR